MTDPGMRETRISSIDAFRGFVMFLLIGAATGFYDLLLAPRFEGTVVHAVGLQFQHHPWNGLTLWDVGQPFFLFISGVAMVFSYGKRWERGETWRATFGHALVRSGLLLLAGWALDHIDPVEGATGAALFADVLPQLALAGLVAFLLLKSPSAVLVGVSAAVLAATELLYRLWPVAGFDRPFTPGHNFGSYVDQALFGRVTADHVVAFTIVPAVTFTIAGVLAGRVLKGGAARGRVLRSLVPAGLAVTALGLALSRVTPVIRHTATSSFVVLCAGLAVLGLALAFWLVDMVRVPKLHAFFGSLGMNPIFIYFFALSGGALWFRALVEPFTMGFAGWIGDWPARALTSLAVWGSMWALCYWMHRRRIFLKL